MDIFFPTKLPYFKRQTVEKLQKYHPGSALELKLDKCESNYICNFTGSQCKFWNKHSLFVCACVWKRGTCVFISLYAWFPLPLTVNPPLQLHWVWYSAPALSHAREEKEKADLAGVHLQIYPTGQLGVSQRSQKGRPRPRAALQRPTHLPELLSCCIRSCQVTKISLPNVNRSTQIQRLHTL